MCSKKKQEEKVLQYQDKEIKINKQKDEKDENYCYMLNENDDNGVGNVGMSDSLPNPKYHSSY